MRYKIIHTADIFGFLAINGGGNAHGIDGIGGGTSLV